MIHWQYWDEVFRSALELFIDCSYEEFLDELRTSWGLSEYEIEEIASLWDNVNWRYFSIWDFCIIWIKEKDIGCLSHELIHYIRDIVYVQRWVLLHKLNDEPMAYLYEAIFSKIYEDIRWKENKQIDEIMHE